MDLSLSEEQQQIVDSAVTYLQEACTMPAVRIASESDSGLDTALWSGMAELGWCGVHLPEEAGGLGLGLVICKGIVEAHDGEISVTSSDEDGTTFTVLL